MVNPIPDGVKRLWGHWNIRVALLFSLLLQVILILFASLRKRTAHKTIIFLIWSGYLLADAVANFAIGHITSSQGSPDPSSSPKNSDLLAFWAPFLLVHLGGPDTITAFALEDNELWLRHLLSFIAQAGATIYVFVLTLPTNKVLIPTILLLGAGVIKYLERTISLYLASVDQFRDSMLKEPDPGPNYAKLMEEYDSKLEAKLPTEIIIIEEPDKEMEATRDDTEIRGRLDDLQVVQQAYEFFNIFKGLFVDLIFSFKDRNESRNFFHSIKAEDALRVIEVELNFIYEILFTKAVVVHSQLGYIARFLSFSSVTAALAVFYFCVKKHGFDEFDVKVTYVLLFGSIGLDTVAFLRAIVSDWTVAAQKPEKVFNSSWKSLRALFSAWKVPLFNVKSVILELIGFQRWSKSVSGYNLIQYCLKWRQSILDVFMDKVIDLVGLRDFVDGIIHVSREPFSQELWEFIFDELKMKSKFAGDPEDAKTICSARGNWVLLDNDWDKYRKELMPYVLDVTYDESLLLWHIATELLYNTDNIENNDKKFSKVLSDYMLYLLIMQPNLMAAVAGIGKIRFRDSCAEAKRFFKGRDIRSDEKKACGDILYLNTEVKPIHVKGDRSKSVLFDASRLAKELRKLEGKKWELLSKMWVELLSYAASHCRANAHAQQVSKGGELITFVWLLMAHFGLGEQFQINKGHARAKLIVGK